MKNLTIKIQMHRPSKNAHWAANSRWWDIKYTLCIPTQPLLKILSIHKLSRRDDGLWQNIKKNDPFWRKKLGDAKVAFDDANIFFYTFLKLQ